MLSSTRSTACPCRSRSSSIPRWRIPTCASTLASTPAPSRSAASRSRSSGPPPAGLLSGPLRSRFGLVHHLRFYNQAELLDILARSCRLLGVERPEAAALATIAARSRGTPRIANRLLRRVRDFAQVRGNGAVTTQTVDGALDLEGVDAIGLDPLDRAYLKTIGEVYDGGPVGLETVAATMNEDPGTLEDVVEPYLLQVGFLARTRRGRMLTRRAPSTWDCGSAPPRTRRGTACSSRSTPGHAAPAVIADVICYARPTVAIA